MALVPATVSKRLIATVPKFQAVLRRAKERDINESDTVTIVTDILSDVFGFDKYSEITREHGIQGTYCDFAIKTEKGVEYLIEVKAIGLSLKASHLRQAENYAAREGIQWVVLTNGIEWEVHHLRMEDKMRSEKILSFDLTKLKVRQKEAQEMLFMLCKRGVQKDLISYFYRRKQSINCYTIGAFILTDDVVKRIRLDLRKYKPDLKVEASEIEELIKKEVIKREILESDAGIEARKQVSRHFKRMERRKAK